MEKKAYGAHALLLSYPTQGHINPMLQFSKRLVSKGLKATLATTLSITKSMQLDCSSVQIDAILMATMTAVSPKPKAKHKRSGQVPIDCIIYDAFLPWALDVAKEFGLVGAAFFTQTCAVTYIFYYVHHGLLTLPVSSPPVSIPGLPLLDLEDMPSFISAPDSYPAYLKMVLDQFCNVDKADCILVNSFYKLEDSVVDAMSKVCTLLTIGPTIPSFFSDKRVNDDMAYGLNFFKAHQSETCIEWLSSKPKGSVVYVSFGSMASLSEEQMGELAWGLKGSSHYFLWVVRASEEAKLPKGFINEELEKGFLVRWCPQLEVLASNAIGCFFTHCGWNSTSEALTLGVGVRVREGEDGVVRREEIEACIREVMEGERGKEMKENAMKWSGFTREAVGEGGTSDRNIDEFVSKLKVGMATGGFGTGHPYPIPVPKRFSYFPTRPKPGTGRGGHSHPRIELKLCFPSPARPDPGMCCRGGAGRGGAVLAWVGLG
ncbi:UDP-glycosyltransferase 74F2 [Vitis vinifera]|uniref:UDP-glycosyltransferase 74F2 n=1 Tax=Vitis vinifera TaxID=29760 RepID=A0A438GR57_VITVI|nr:UDP-glycosyltransferase 74F2 [Vitis vinifera]